MIELRALNQGIGSQPRRQTPACGRGVSPSLHVHGALVPQGEIALFITERDLGDRPGKPRAQQHVNRCSLP